MTLDSLGSIDPLAFENNPKCEVIHRTAGELRSAEGT